MIYNAHFEMATVVMLFILIIIYFWKKNLPIQSNRLYLNVLILLVVGTCFSALQCYYEYGNDKMSLSASYIISSLAFIIGIAFIGMYNSYVLSLFHYKNKVSVYSVVSYGVILCGIILVLTNSFTNLYFYMDDSGKLHSGNARNIMNILYMFIIFLTLCIAWIKGKKKDTKLLKLILHVDILIALSELITNVCHLNTGFIMVVANLCAFLVYFSLRSPDYYIDIRTGRFNLNGFIEVLREKYDYNESVSCFLIRVKNYHAICRIYDEDSLQEVQKQIAEILKVKSGERNIYHIGAATFAIFVENTKEVKKLYEKIVRVMPHQWNIKREALSHEYSYYYVTYPDDSSDIEDIIQRIHYARSDHEGHHKPNELIHLRKEALVDAVRFKEVAHRIEEAILDNSLELNFQPIYSFAENRITSLEVLSRLKDNKHKYINPEYFIHVAEVNHTIIQLSRQMFEKTCQFAVNNRIFERGITDMNINISPIQCQDKHLVDELKRIAAKYRIPLKRFHFEITESRLTDADAVFETLTKLRKCGAKIALDDFGTGYSNIASIMLMPIDFVKIDKSLLWSYASGDNEFLNELMPMIRSEGKKIIAEGIETEEHIEILRRMGGDFLQGYYYSKPLNEKDFIRFIDAHNKNNKNKSENNKN